MLQIHFYFLIFEKYKCKIGKFSPWKTPEMDLAGTRDILFHSGAVPGNPGLSRAIRDTWSPYFRCRCKCSTITHWIRECSIAWTCTLLIKYTSSNKRSFKNVHCSLNTPVAINDHSKTTFLLPCFTLVSKSWVLARKNSGKFYNEFFCIFIHFQALTALMRSFWGMPHKLSLNGFSLSSMEKSHLITIHSLHKVTVQLVAHTKLCRL